MRLRATLLPGLLAGALPLAGFAQNAVSAPVNPQFFVGLGAAIGTYQMPYGVGNIVSPMPAVGLQLRPRWAVQASGIYFSKDYSYASPGRFYINGKLQDGIYSGASQRRVAAVPVLVRYTLSHRPQRRLQADLLGGFAVVHSVFRGADTTTDSTQAVVSANRFDAAATGFYLVLGPGLRYRLGQHIDLTGDFVFNFLVSNYQNYFSSSRAAATAAAGLRYRFGRS